MAPFQDTDAPFRAGSPLLPILEPPRSLERSPLRAARIPVGNGDAPDAHSGQRIFIGRRVECPVRRLQVRHPPKLPPVLLQSAYQQAAVPRLLRKYLV